MLKLFPPPVLPKTRPFSFALVRRLETPRGRRRVWNRSWTEESRSRALKSPGLKYARGPQRCW